MKIIDIDQFREHPRSERRQAKEDVGCELKLESADCFLESPAAAAFLLTL